MGIPELWREIGDGEITSLSKLSAEHYERFKRPLRIAVDVPGWRYNNLSEFQVQAIRDRSGEQAFQGNEKLIYYRLVSLLRLNIRFLFVFDGNRRPWKNGRRSGGITESRFTLLKQLCDRMNIPCHAAPGEAEAECAKLQQLGVVDAVWSEDADALMFGSGMLIRDYRVEKSNVEPGNSRKSNTMKSTTHVRVYRLHELHAKYGLGREGLVLFAVLAGGDYHRAGLPGCGEKKAMKVIRHPGLAEFLYQCHTKQDLAQFRVLLRACFQKAGTRLHVPEDFPKPTALKNYCHPTVSSHLSPDQFMRIQSKWEAEIDELALLRFVGPHFNFWTKDYLSKVCPVLLAKDIMRNPLNLQNRWDVQVCWKKRGANKEPEDPYDDVKISFSPFAVSSLDLDNLPTMEWLGKKTPAYADWSLRVEADMPLWILRLGLPKEIFQPPEPASKTKGTKRKSTGKDNLQPADGSKDEARKKPKTGHITIECEEINVLLSPEEPQDRTGLTLPNQPQVSSPAVFGQAEVITLSDDEESPSFSFNPGLSPAVSSGHCISHSDRSQIVIPKPTKHPPSFNPSLEVVDLTSL